MTPQDGNPGGRTSLPYRGPLVVLSVEEARSLLPLLVDAARGTTARDIYRKCQVSSNSDPRFRKPTT